ncbi:MAG: hypothetical protein WCJ30_15445, partial [Deltaproteobacteria bacterium]
AACSIRIHASSSTSRSSRAAWSARRDERTEREFREILGAAGFELVRVLRTPATDIVEGRPVS